MKKTKIVTTDNRDEFYRRLKIWKGHYGITNAVVARFYNGINTPLILPIGTYKTEPLDYENS
jgi:hypothetical protein